MIEFLIDTLTVERSMILIGFLLLCFTHQQVLDAPELRVRLSRFYATMISKKIFAWGVVTCIFIFDRYYADMRGDWILEYLGFTSGTFVIDVGQKWLGLKGKE